MSDMPPSRFKQLAPIFFLSALALARAAHGQAGPGFPYYKGLRPDSCGPVFLVVHEKDDAAALEALLKTGASLQEDPRCMRPPLHEAVRQGKRAMVRLLLSKKADPNALSLSGDIPLTEAINNSHPQDAALGLIDELLAGGAEINGRDALGRTALIWTRIRNYDIVFDALLSKGADPRITDTDGRTVFDYDPPAGTLRQHLVAAAARMKGPVPPPVFTPPRSVSWMYDSPSRIGKEARVGITPQGLRVIDPAGTVVGAAPAAPVQNHSLHVPPHFLDLDGDGVRDVSILVVDNSPSDPRPYDNEFSLFVSLRGGLTNLLVNYDKKADRLTGNTLLGPSLRGPVTAELERRGELDSQTIERLLASYTLMVDVEALATLQKLHADARRAYKAKKPSRAASLLEGKLEGTALSTLDPSGRDDRVTAILNDYGFFLAEAGQLPRAIATLQLVIARAPDRAVAHLNLADAEWARGNENGARVYYRRYAELLGTAGKEEKIPARVTQRLAGK
jgi:hypothetical protein